VLELVAQHELDELGSRAPHAAGEHLLRARADLLEVAAGAGRVEQRERAAYRARRLEGVVERGELGVQELPAADAVADPQVLVGRDVREVPDQRGHERIDHALEVARREVGDQGQRRRARRRQVPGGRPGSDGGVAGRHGEQSPPSAGP
jgi:hypothetical protein